MYSGVITDLSTKHILRAIWLMATVHFRPGVRVNTAETLAEQVCSYSCLFCIGHGSMTIFCLPSLVTQDSGAPLELTLAELQPR